MDRTRLDELRTLLEQLRQRVDALEEEWRASVNAAYAQGVRDARKRASGVDELVERKEEGGA